QFVLQLARAPAGAAERDHRRTGALALRQRLEHVAGGGHVHALPDRQARIPATGAVMHHEAALRMHRSAGHHLARVQGLVVAVDPHLPEHLAEGVLRRPVHHHAHRAVAVVLADQGHAAREIGVGQRRQRDQHLPGKGLGGFHAAILACARMAAPPLPEPPCTPSATTAPCCWPPSSPSPWRVASAAPSRPPRTLRLRPVPPPLPPPNRLPAAATDASTPATTPPSPSRPTCPPSTRTASA